MRHLSVLMSSAAIGLTSAVLFCSFGCATLHNSGRDGFSSASSEKLTVDQLARTPDGHLRFRCEWKVEGGIRWETFSSIDIRMSFRNEDGTGIGEEEDYEFMLDSDFREGKTERCQHIIEIGVPTTAKFISVAPADNSRLRVNNIPIPAPLAYQGRKAHQQMARAFDLQSIPIIR